MTYIRQNQKRQWSPFSSPNKLTNLLRTKVSLKMKIALFILGYIFFKYYFISESSSSTELSGIACESDVDCLSVNGQCDISLKICSQYSVVDNKDQLGIEAAPVLTLNSINNTEVKNETMIIQDGEQGLEEMTSPPNIRPPWWIWALSVFVIVTFISYHWFTLSKPTSIFKFDIT